MLHGYFFLEKVLQTKKSYVIVNVKSEKLCITLTFNFYREKNIELEAGMIIINFRSNIYFRR